jgi:hypothetical protein
MRLVLCLKKYQPERIQTVVSEWQRQVGRIVPTQDQLFPFASVCLVVLPFLFFLSALALRGNLLSPMAHFVTAVHWMGLFFAFHNTRYPYYPS